MPLLSHLPWKPHWFMSPHHFWITQHYAEANANGYYNCKNKVYEQVSHSGRENSEKPRLEQEGWGVEGQRGIVGVNHFESLLLYFLPWLAQ